MQGTRAATRPRPTTAASLLRVTARVALTVVAAAAVAACSGSSAPVASATGATVTTPPASATMTSEPTTTPAEPTSQPTTGAPSTRPTAEPTTATPTRQTTAPSSSPTDSDAGPRTQWPRALGEPTQGGPVWAVYLATGHSSSDAGIERAVADAAAVGYDAVVGDLACDQGAIAALGLDQQHDLWTAATLYFATERDVNAFLTSYRARVGEVVGYARVSLGCLD